MAELMIKDNAPIELIAKYTNLNIEELKKHFGC